MPFFQKNSGKKSRNKLYDDASVLDHKYSKRSQKGKESVHHGFSPSALLLSFFARHHLWRVALRCLSGDTAPARKH